jgi:hypothetical protein
MSTGDVFAATYPRRRLHLLFLSRSPANRYVGQSGGRPPRSPLRIPKRLDEDENRRALSILPRRLKMNDLSLQTGIIFCDVEDPTFENYHTGSKLLHLSASGAFVMRFNETKDNEWWQFVHFLGVAYKFASTLWSTWAVGPIARIQLELDLQRKRIAEVYRELPQVHSDYFPVDFSAQSFSEAFLDAVVRTERAAGKRGSNKDVESLDFVWKNDFDAQDLQARWNQL